MRQRDRNRLEKALATLRDPDGTGRTKVSIRGLGETEFRPVKCLKPIAGGRCALDTGHDGACAMAARSGDGGGG